MTAFTMKYAPEDAERVLRKMFAKLEESGWKVYEVYDGGGWVKATTIDEALDIIDSVEDSTAYFEKPGALIHTVYLIPGNGEDVICDHTMAAGDADGFNAVMDSVISED